MWGNDDIVNDLYGGLVFSCGQNQNDDIEILKPNIFGYIEVVKTPKKKIERD